MKTIARLVGVILLLSILDQNAHAWFQKKDLSPEEKLIKMQKELELKEKSLALREKELKLKEMEMKLESGAVSASAEQVVIEKDQITITGTATDSQKELEAKRQAIRKQEALRIGQSEANQARTLRANEDARLRSQAQMEARLQEKKKNLELQRKYYRGDYLG